MNEILSRVDLADWLFQFALVLTRTSGLVAFCPIFSSRLMPIRFRASIAVVFALVLLPVAPEVTLSADLGGWPLLLARELVVGLGLGIAARAVFDGMEGAARVVAGQSGFALSSMIDPLTGGQSSTPALFQGLLATALILAADLHHLFLRGLLHSYELLPPLAALPATEGLPQAVSVMGARLFGISVELAAPALVVSFAADLVLMLVGRAMPQVPVLMVGYPLKVASGLAALVILTMATGAAIGWIGRTFAHDGAALLSALGAS